ncbi:MAG: hypothetical protein FJW37_12940 [Acidobacteria bacterium]|nr:hypothetical protein [Acidobacteriota bacterium]
MIVLAASLLTILVLVFIVFIRPGDLPVPIPVSPLQHLDDKKAAIYENLRDLTFEYRLGKLSDQDYQQTKLDLQRELAAVLAEIDSAVARIEGAAAKPSPKPAKRNDFLCQQCGAVFQQKLKFCGNCGKPLKT